jgi:hypothetical protein
MDVLELTLDYPMDYLPPTSDYQAGFAHGSVTSGILILFIWMSVWRCMQAPGPRTIKERLEAAERDL